MKSANCKRCLKAFTSRNTNPKFCSRRCADLSKIVPIEKRFWAKVEKTDGCWNWKAGHRKGYGAFHRVRTFAECAHRVSWELVNGKIPEGLIVLHKCDNKNCVNPEHLKLGTNADNTKDALNKGRLAYGERQGNALLTENAVKEIRQLYPKIGAKKLAKKFKVSRSTIYAAFSRQNWSWVI